jgi:hypothetical protein
MGWWRFGPINTKTIIVLSLGELYLLSEIIGREKK